MSWIQGSLQELANPGSEFTWVTYAFAGNDPLETALQPGYFATWGHRLREGDLILWGCNPDRSGKTRMGGQVAIRRALLMVVEAHATRPAVRLVQDWGGVVDAADAMATDVGSPGGPPAAAPPRAKPSSPIRPR